MIHVNQIPLVRPGRREAVDDLHALVFAPEYDHVSHVNTFRKSCCRVQLANYTSLRALRVQKLASCGLASFALDAHLSLLVHRHTLATKQ